MSLRAFNPGQPALGSRLLGSPEESDLRRKVRVGLILTVSLLIANAIGVAVSVALVFFVLPGPSVLESRFLVPTAIITPVYVTCAVAAGVLWASVLATRTVSWTRSTSSPTPRQQRATLALPWRITAMQAFLWLLGSAVITSSYGLIDTEAIPKVGFTILLSGLSVCCAAYLLTEFALRPVAALALQFGPVKRFVRFGTVARVRVVWLLSTGVPVIGLILVGIFALTGDDATLEGMAVAVFAIGAAALLVGLLLTSMLAWSVVAPIRSVRKAMDAVADGSFDTRVVVYDGTELGDLQRGFNDMAAGLRERERLRDLFGRHVGKEVARAAEEADPELGGQARDVGVLFVDVVGSTAMAAERPAEDVVAVLNRFFDVVVEVAGEHDGMVDKFLGDAALVVFGAPAQSPDPAGSALACARDLARRLGSGDVGCTAGIGVAYGRAVAGYLGSSDRFEYTVIGDAVNEASRLCDLAKDTEQFVLASGVAVDAARRTGEKDRWRAGDTVTVRGRTEETVLHSPVAAG